MLAAAAAPTCGSLPLIFGHTRPPATTTPTTTTDARGRHFRAAVSRSQRDRDGLERENDLLRAELIEARRIAGLTGPLPGGDRGRAGEPAYGGGGGAPAA
eukprot:6610511-Prymnesium_polylepis.1